MNVGEKDLLCDGEYVGCGDDVDSYCFSDGFVDGLNDNDVVGSFEVEGKVEGMLESVGIVDVEGIGETEGIKVGQPSPN